jgi:hypothetical protein
MARLLGEPNANVAPRDAVAPASSTNPLAGQTSRQNPSDNNEKSAAQNMPSPVRRSFKISRINDAAPKNPWFIHAFFMTSNHGSKSAAFTSASCLSSSSVNFVLIYAAAS